MPIRLVARRCRSCKRVIIEPRLTQSQVQCTTDIPRSLRITVQSGIQADALQVAALHIARHGIHLVRAGIEYLHAVDGGGNTLGLHIVDHRLPGVRPTSHQIDVRQLRQVLINGRHLSLGRTFATLLARDHHHLIQPLRLVNGGVGLQSDSQQ